MQIRRASSSNRPLVLTFLVWFLLTTILLQMASTSYAATQLLNRFDKTESSVVGANSRHLIGFTLTDFATPVGSLAFEFCANDPVPEAACTAPTGLDLSGVSLSSQTGETGFSIHPNSTVSTLVLGRPAVAPTTADIRYELSGVINPTTLGTYFIRLYTFSSVDGTGLPIETGGIALSTSEALSVSAEVPPYLRFCAGVTIISFDCSTATSFFIDFGEFSTDNEKTATSQFVVATNAASGYTVTLAGTTLTSGNNTIPGTGGPAVSATGTSQFGLNLRSNSGLGIGANPTGPGTANPTANYNIPNRYSFQPGDTLVTVGNSNDNRKFTASFIANISNGQAAGIYATTISYICLANF